MWECIPREEGAWRGHDCFFPEDCLSCEQNCAVLLRGAEMGPMEFTEADFGSTSERLCARESCPIIELAAWGDGAMSELSIFGNVLAEPEWPSVVGIVERCTHAVDEQNFVDDDNSSKCDSVY